MSQHHVLPTDRWHDVEIPDENWCSRISLADLHVIIIHDYFDHAFCWLMLCDIMHALVARSIERECNLHAGKCISISKLKSMKWHMHISVTNCNKLGCVQTSVCSWMWSEWQSFGSSTFFSLNVRHKLSNTFIIIIKLSVVKISV